METFELKEALFELYRYETEHQNVAAKRGCQICRGRHHTSICDKTPDKMLTATGEGTVTYPVVVVIVNGVKCQALLDTGAGSCYVSEALVRHLGKKPVRREHRCIDIMMHYTKKSWWKSMM